MTEVLSHSALLDALAFQIELGATEAIGETPVDRYTLPATLGKTAPSAKPAPAEITPQAPHPSDMDPVAIAKADAGSAQSLADLQAALTAFPHCELRKGARSTVFADGRPEARLMIIGEAPGRDEDIQGKPFVGRAGQLLDRMFAAIGMDRMSPDPNSALYITNVLPWRPPNNRDPNVDEAAMMQPFLERHVALADPQVLVIMGNHACHALLGKRGITRLRGNWTQALDRPALPMFHPAYLLRNPAAKRQAWADLLSLRDRLKSN